MKTTITIAAMAGALALAAGCAYRGQVVSVYAETVYVGIDQMLEGGGSLSAQADLGDSAIRSAGAARNPALAAAKSDVLQGAVSNIVGKVRSGK